MYQIYQTERKQHHQLWQLKKHGVVLRRQGIVTTDGQWRHEGLTGKNLKAHYTSMKVLTPEGLPTVVEVKDQAICYARHLSRESCAVALRTQVGTPRWLGHTKCSVPATIASHAQNISHE